jgi:competence protein ComGC
MRDNKGKSFVTIMVIIAVCAFCLRIVIDRVIKLNIAQNESNAQGTLKLISAALESYARDNRGIYPVSLSTLTKPSPPYLDKDYITQSQLKGYNYSCSRLEPSGYSCYAGPTKCKLSGNTIYNITTGSLLVSEACEK